MKNCACYPEYVVGLDCICPSRTLSLGYNTVSFTGPKDICSFGMLTSAMSSKCPSMIFAFNLALLCDICCDDDSVNVKQP
uniref:Ovule protein n=1 Tax=Ascaris lumbricoides TaxID=6252 RepID=A0A0M3HSG6_ASCLU